MSNDGNDNSAGLVADDARRAADHRGRCADTFRVLKAAKTTLEARGCWRLAREIEDEIARWESEVHAGTLPLFPVSEGQRSGEGVHGENPQNAEVRQHVCPGYLVSGS